MSRARLALLICGVLLVVSGPTAAAKTDVPRLARRALHIAERADKAARAKPKPIASKNIARGGVANRTSPTAPSTPGRWAQPP